MAKSIGTIPTLLLTAAGFGDVVTKINADLAAGAITLAEGADIAETIIPHVAAYLPAADQPIATAVGKVIAAGIQAEAIVAPALEELITAIKAAEAAKPATPAPAAGA